jgi:alkyl hydroperoxide reductase subunit AhpC
MKYFIVALGLVVLVACSKSGGDTQKPVLVLTSPTGGQTFTGSSTVNIIGTAEDNDELHEIHVTVINKNTDTEVLHVHNHADAKSYNIHETFTAQSGVTYKIEVEANDHVGNTTIIQIEVSGI